jgi:hypothetical protein
MWVFITASDRNFSQQAKAAARRLFHWAAAAAWPRENTALAEGNIEPLPGGGSVKIAGWKTVPWRQP